jgi:hypothetical protein
MWLCARVEWRTLGKYAGDAALTPLAAITGVKVRKLRDIVNRLEEALDRRTAPRRGDRKYGRRGSPRDAPTLRAEQAAEGTEPLAKGGPLPMTSGQWKGTVLGGLVGGVIGIVVMLPVALVPFVDSVVIRIVVVAVIGLLAGATAGAVYLGGRMPELEGETIDVDGDPSVGTSLRDPDTDPRGR